MFKIEMNPGFTWRLMNPIASITVVRVIMINSSSHHIVGLLITHQSRQTLTGPVAIALVDAAGVGVGAAGGVDVDRVIRFVAEA